MAKFLCICLSSTIQRSITFDKLALTKVNRSKKYRIDASGKAVNSARVLKQMGNSEVKVICPLGKENASLFIDLLKNDQVDLSYVEIPGYTRECWTLMDFSELTTTELVVSEPAENLMEGASLSKEQAAEKEAEFLALVKKEIPEYDAVLLAGSRPSLWSDKVYPEIAAMAKAAGKVFLADFWAEDLVATVKSAAPAIIKINDEEFCKTFKVTAEKNESVEQALKSAIIEISRILGNIIIVTRGTKTTLAAHNGKFYSCPCKKVTPVNTTACGDSFNSGFLWEYLNSGDVGAALEKGTWAAAANAERECPGAVN